MLRPLLTRSPALPPLNVPHLLPSSLWSRSPEIDEIIDDALAARTPEPAPPPRKTGASARSATSEREAAQAATVLRAGQREPGPSVVGYSARTSAGSFGMVAALFYARFRRLRLCADESGNVRNRSRHAPRARRRLPRRRRPQLQPAADARRRMRQRRPQRQHAPAAPLPLTSLLPPEPARTRRNPLRPRRLCRWLPAFLQRRCSSRSSCAGAQRRR